MCHRQQLLENALDLEPVIHNTWCVQSEPV